MANTTIGTGSPKLYVDYSAKQISGSGNKRTIQITAKFKVNGSTYESRYGYACNWKARIGSVTGSWQKMKGTETWRATHSLRTFYQTLEIDVGTTSSKEITIYIDTDSISNSSWDGSCSWKMTVGATNMPPTWPSGSKLTFYENSSSGAIITNEAEGTENVKIIGENVSKIYMTWPRATDPNDDDSKLVYEVWGQSNNSDWTKLTTTGVDVKNYTHTIGAGNQGRTYDYYVEAVDPSGSKTATNCDGTQFAKNTLHGHKLSSSSSVTASSTSISFTYSGARNTNGNTSITTSLTSPEITVYNSSSSPSTVTIYKSGALPKGCYIKYDDIKNKFKNNSYKGTLNFTLTTYNIYGSSRTSTKSISVNLQVSPTAPTVTLSTSTSESTAYKQVTTGTDNTTSWKYVIDGHRTIRVKWTAGSDGLDTPMKYTVWYRIGASGDWIQIASNLTGLYHTHTVPLNTNERTIQYRVRAISTLNSSHYKDGYSPTTSYEYHTGVNLTAGAITRTTTNVKVAITLAAKTSLLLPQIVATARLYNKGTSTQVGSTYTLSTVSGAKSNVSISGLTEGGVYDLKIVYKDKTGLTTDKTHLISVSSVLPILDIQPTGVGIKSSSSPDYSLNINGPIRITNQGEGSKLIHFDAERSWSLEQAFSGSESSLALRTITSDKSFYFLSPNKERYVKVTLNDNAPTEMYVDGNKVYHKGNNPSAVDLQCMGASKPSGQSFYAMQTPTRTDDWIRTTTHGILPYSNGTGSLGTSAWRFANIYSNSLNGFSVGSVSGRYTSHVPVVGSDGVMEVGSIIDFHRSNSNADYDGRITVGSDGLISFENYIGVAGRVFKGWAITSGGNYWVGLSGDDTNFRTYKETADGSVYANGVTNLGSDTCRWKKLYAASASSTTSDARVKENIEVYDAKIEELYSKLKPCSFTRIDGDSGRRHYGFISQEVEEAVLDTGMEYHDFAPLYKCPLDENGDDIKAETISNYETDERIVDYQYSLCYEEFIPLNTHMIQKLQNENKEMRKEIDELKRLVASLVNKGGDEVDKSQDKPTEGAVSE